MIEKSRPVFICIILFALIQTAVADVSSTFSASLSTSSPLFISNNLGPGSHYYQSLQVVFSVSGTYTFKSLSSVDTYGFLYSPSFDPSSPMQNIITYDDDGAGANQFRLQADLVYGRSYILVVTTYQANTVGAFSIMTSGPGTVSFLTYTSTTGRTSTSTRVTTPTGYPTTVSGSLSSVSPVFQPSFGPTGRSRYQAFLMSVTTAGTYSFTSSSNIDLVGYLYSYPFNPFYPNENFITYDDDSGSASRQFRITTNLQYTQQYVLVVASYGPDLAGTFVITTTGPSSLYLTSLTPATAPATGSMTTPFSYSPTYSGFLSFSSSVFIPYNRPSGYYYYDAIRVTVSSSNVYTFTSDSSSSMDTYGYLYSTSFDPSYPSTNLVTSDDDSAGAGQFRITRTLSAGATYILVVSTYTTSITGSYRVTVSGAGSISLVGYTPSTSRPIRTTTTDSYWPSTYSSSSTTIIIIVTSTIGTVLLIVFSIIAAAMRNSRQQTNLRFQPAASTGNRNIRVQIRPTNFGNPNTYHIAYANPVRGANVHNIEEPPPSYESVASIPKGKEQNNTLRV